MQQHRCAHAHQRHPRLAVGQPRTRSTAVRWALPPSAERFWLEAAQHPVTACANTYILKRDHPRVHAAEDCNTRNCQQPQPLLCRLRPFSPYAAAHVHACGTGTSQTNVTRKLQPTRRTSRSAGTPLVSQQASCSSCTRGQQLQSYAPAAASPWSPFLPALRKCMHECDAS
jgi:hypothetical protein